MERLPPPPPPDLRYLAVWHSAQNTCQLFASADFQVKTSHFSRDKKLPPCVIFSLFINISSPIWRLLLHCHPSPALGPCSISLFPIFTWVIPPSQGSCCDWMASQSNKHSQLVLSASWPHRQQVKVLEGEWEHYKSITEYYLKECWGKCQTGEALSGTTELFGLSLSCLSCSGTIWVFGLGSVFTVFFHPQVFRVFVFNQYGSKIFHQYYKFPNSLSDSICIIIELQTAIVFPK